MLRATPHHGFLIRASAATFAGAVLAGLGLAHLLLRADWRTAVIAFIFVGAGVVGLQILRDWRFGIVSFFVWIVLEDAIRKYLGNRIILYGAKDVLIGLTYVSFLFAQAVRRRPWDFRNPIRAPLIALIALAVAECFNPQIEHPLMPVIGMRMYFLYIPLLYLGYAYIDSEERLRRFLLFTLVLGSVVSGLGVIQAVIGLDFLNPKGFVPGLRLELIRVAPESQMAVPRPTSVFVDAGRFAHYLFILFFLGLGAISYWHALRGEPEGRRSGGKETGRDRREMRALLWLMWRTPSALRRQECLVWIAFGMISAGLIVSAQRAALILAGAALLVLVGVACRERFASWIARCRRSAFPLGKIVVGMALARSGLAVFHAERLVALYRFCAETLSPVARESEVTWRPQVYWTDILVALRESRAFGHGTGTASLGLTYLYGLDDFYSGATWSPYRVEGGYASVIWEWGIVGVGLWIWWTLALIWVAGRTARRLAPSRFFGLAVALVLFLALLHVPYFFLGMSVYQNYVNNAYHWFLVGMLFRLPKLAGGRPEALTV